MDVMWLVSRLLLRVAEVQGDGCEVHRRHSRLCLAWDVENGRGTRADVDSEGLWNHSACLTGNCWAPESLLSQSFAVGMQFVFFC